MALNIKNHQTERLAHLLAEATGESLTEAVTIALRERLAAVSPIRDVDGIIRSVGRIQAMVAALPVRDDRTADEILGYDARGLPS